MKTQGVKRKAFLLAVFISLFSLIMLNVGEVHAQTDNTPWPQFQYDDKNTGYRDVSSTDLMGSPIKEIWIENMGGDFHGPEDPTVGDVNGDGLMEVVISTDNDYVYALDNNGSKSWEFPATDPSSTVIVDYDIDNNLEVVFTTNDNLYILNGSDGSVEGNYSPDNSIVTRPIVGDVNGDGYQDFMAMTDNYVFVLDHNTNLLWTSPRLNIGGLALGEIDGDENLELVTTANQDPYDMKVFHAENGSLLWEWDQTGTGSGLYVTPTVANLDSDKVEEVIVPAVGSSSSKLYAVDDDNTTLWSVDIQTETSPAVSDINEDGENEIVVGRSYDQYITALDNSGSVIWSYPTNDDAKTPSLSDLDGDGSTEIVVGCDDDNIYILNSDGSLIDSYDAGYVVRKGIAIADITNDGNLDIIAPSYNYNLYALTLSQANPPVVKNGASGITVSVENVDRDIDTTYSGITEDATITFRVRDNNGNSDIAISKLFIRDNSDTVVIDNVSLSENSVIDENTLEFSYNYNPMDNAETGAYDVRLETYDVGGASDIVDFVQKINVVDVSTSINISDSSPNTGDIITISGTSQLLGGSVSLDKARIVANGGNIRGSTDGENWSAEYEVDKSGGTEISIKAELLDIGSRFDGENSLSFTVQSGGTLPPPTYDDDEDVEISGVTGKLIDDEFVPKSSFTVGETVVVRAKVTVNGQSAEIAEVIGKFDDAEFEISHIGNGTYQGSFTLPSDTPVGTHLVRKTVTKVDVDDDRNLEDIKDRESKDIVKTNPFPKPPKPSEFPRWFKYLAGLGFFLFLFLLPEDRWKRTPRNWWESSRAGSWTFSDDSKFMIILTILAIGFILLTYGIVKGSIFYGLLAIIIIIGIISEIDSSKPLASIGFDGKEEELLILSGFFFSVFFVYASSWLGEIFPGSLWPYSILSYLLVEVPKNVAKLATMVAIPVLECFLYRGIISPTVAERWGVYPSIFGVALFFGFSHILFGAGLFMMLIATLFGIVMGWMVLRNQSVLFPLVAHITYNSIVVLISMGILGVV